MSDWKHLTFDAILAIHREVLKAHGGGEGIRSRELLESALAAPQATFGGQPIMTDGIEIASAYLYYLCSNHPFVDGNKRVALAACLIFLRQNELFSFTSLPVDPWETLTLAVAAGKLDRAQTTAALRRLVQA